MRSVLVVGMAAIFVLSVVAQDDSTQRDEEIVRQAGLKTDGQSLVHFLAGYRKNCERIPELIRELDDDNFQVRKKASDDLIALGAVARQHLEAAKKHDSLEVRRQAEKCLEQLAGSGQSQTLHAAIRLASVKNVPETSNTLVGLAPHLDSFALEELSTSLTRLALRDGKPNLTLVEATGDKHPNKRVVAGVALARAKVIEPARKLLKDEAARVRLGVGMALVEHAGAKEAMPVLIGLLSDLPATETWRLEALLRDLAGKQSPARSTPADPTAYRDAWLAWWTKHEMQVDLAKVEWKSVFHLAGNKVLKGHSAGVASVAFAPDGRSLISGSQDGTIRLWDAVRGIELRTFKGNERAVRSVSFSSDGRTIASGADDGTIKLLDVVTAKELHSFKGIDVPGGVYSVTFAPDGKSLASGGNDRAIRRWDVATAKELRSFKPHNGPLLSVAFSPDARSLVCGGTDETIKSWDAETGKERRGFKGHTKYVLSVSFSPDGSTLVSGSGDGTIRTWDPATGKESRLFKGHASGVTSVQFSPDGRSLASASGDGTIRLWDVATGKELWLGKEHAGSVTSVAFSPDGRRLASCGADMTVRIWDLLSLNLAR